MHPEEFILWLQGFAELNPAPPTQEQWQGIREQLCVVYARRDERDAYRAKVLGARCAPSYSADGVQWFGDGFAKAPGGYGWIRKIPE